MTRAREARTSRARGGQRRRNGRSARCCRPRRWIEHKTAFRPAAAAWRPPLPYRPDAAVYVIRWWSCSWSAPNRPHRIACGRGEVTCGSLSIGVGRARTGRACSRSSAPFTGHLSAEPTWSRPTHRRCLGCEDFPPAPGESEGVGGARSARLAVSAPIPRKQAS